MGGALHALTLRFLLRQSSTLGYGDLIEQLRDEMSWRHLKLADVVPEDWLLEYHGRATQSAQEAWNATVIEVDRMLDVVEESLRRGALADDEATLAALGCFDSKVNGSGTVTAVAALYIVARSAARPMSGLLSAAFLKNADTDTLASMVASCLGALHGPDWLGMLATEVQDSAYIGSLARHEGSPSAPGQASLFSTQLAADAQTPRVSNSDMTRFARILDEGAVQGGTFVDGRDFTIEDRVQLESKVRASVTRFRLRLEDGQTIVVDRMRKASSAEQSPSRVAGDATNREHSQVRRITLLVRDIDLMTNFYRSVLGLSVHEHGSDAVDVGQGLRLRSDPSAPSGPRGVVVELESDDISRARLKIRRQTETEAFYVECDDPEGNRVIVYSTRGQVATT